MVKSQMFGGTSFFLTFTPFLCPFSVLAMALFIYYTSGPTGTEGRIEVK